MYAGVTFPPMDITELGCRAARHGFADLLHRSAVEGAITYITLRGRRMAAVVPPAVADAAARDGDQSCLWCGSSPAPHRVHGDPVCGTCHRDHHEEAAGRG